MVSILNGNSPEHYTHIAECEVNYSNNSLKQTIGVPQGAAVQKNPTETKCFLVHIAKPALWLR